MRTIDFVSKIFISSLLVFAPAAIAEKAIDINGLWSDSNNPNCENCYAIIAQDGDDIFFAHYIEWKGKPLVEYGKGKRIGNIIEYQVTVTRQIPGWASAGKHRLELSKDGQSLKGSYQDNLGNKGPFSLVRSGQ
ncbi:hypothetical protein TDB9533_00624 [Thalassocella blandensis]|nr:hypothetical protein TDB9533_00624 [Thalassocella blandensis]